MDVCFQLPVRESSFLELALVVAAAAGAGDDKTR